tara:strand:+ start:452 stop:1129 length:678 start_codon:yes stop_codon:yes gene_type:complete
MQDNFLHTVPVFKGLSDDEFDSLAPYFSIKNYPKNSMIVLEEEYGDTVYFVKEGTIKISRLNDEGKEVILALLGNGEFFGELSALDGEARSANAHAQENCIVYSINSNDFIHVLKTNFKITHSLLAELAKRIRKSDKQIEALSLSDAEHRIGVCILNFAEERGVIRKGQVTIENLPYQQDIANMAGTSRETVSRVFKLLEDRHLIFKQGHTLMIPDYSYFKRVFG